MRLESFDGRRLAELLSARRAPPSPVMSVPDLPASLRLAQNMSEQQEDSDPDLAASIAWARSLQEAEDAITAHSKAIMSQRFGL